MHTRVGSISPRHSRRRTTEDGANSAAFPRKCSFVPQRNIIIDSSNRKFAIISFRVMLDELLIIMTNGSAFRMCGQTRRPMSVTTPSAGAEISEIDMEKIAIREQFHVLRSHCCSNRNVSASCLGSSAALIHFSIQLARSYCLPDCGNWLFLSLCLPLAHHNPVTLRAPETRICTINYCDKHLRTEHYHYGAQSEFFPRSPRLVS